MSKKSVDMNNFNHKPDGPNGSPKKKINKELESASGNWLNTDTKGQINKDYSNYNGKSMKQSQLTSAFDNHGYSAPEPAAATKAPEGPAVQPTDYKNENVRKTQQQKQAFLSSQFAGHDALKYHQ